MVSCLRICMQKCHLGLAGGLISEGGLNYNHPLWSKVLLCIEHHLSDLEWKAVSPKGIFNSIGFRNTGLKWGVVSQKWHAYCVQWNKMGTEILVSNEGWSLRSGMLTVFNQAKWAHKYWCWMRCGLSRYTLTGLSCISCWPSAAYRLSVAWRNLSSNASL